MKKYNRVEYTLLGLLVESLPLFTKHSDLRSLQEYMEMIPKNELNLPIYMKAIKIANERDDDNTLSVYLFQRFVERALLATHPLTQEAS